MAEGSRVRVACDSLVTSLLLARAMIVALVNVCVDVGKMRVVSSNRLFDVYLV